MSLARTLTRLLHTPARSAHAPTRLLRMPIRILHTPTPIEHQRRMSSDSISKIQRSSRPLRVGVIGFGAVGSKVVQEIEHSTGGAAVVTSVLDSYQPIIDKLNAERSSSSAFPKTDGDWVGTSFDDFLKQDWDLCVECAGQPVAKDTARAVLESGRDYLLASIGVLTDDQLHEDLLKVAKEKGCRLLIPSGAMPALDWMHSATLAHNSIERCKEDTVKLPTVCVTQLKPPQSWKGTPAAETHDLDGLMEHTVLFEGTAREAASLFPKNSNVACALAVSTSGLDNVKVKLATDPKNPKGGTSVSFESDIIGKISIDISAKMSPTNPKTSAIVAWSMVKAIKNQCCGGEVIGA